MMRLSLLVGLGLVLTGCTSFYSSSIVGHDSPTLPLPRERGGRGLAVGFDLRTSPTGSLFTSDSTQSILGSAFVRQRVIDFGWGQVDLQANLSEYYALTTLVDRERNGSLGSPEASYSGFGTVVGLRPSMILNGEGNRAEVAVHALYNQEFGDYKALRASFASSGSNTMSRVDLSPHGRTASVALELRREFVAGGDWRLSNGEVPRITIGADLGFVLFDWPYSRDGKATARMSFVYGLEGLWMSLATHLMPPLNIGVSLGIGASTRL